jgi:hypothetical protein
MRENTTRNISRSVREKASVEAWVDMKTWTSYRNSDSSSFSGNAICYSQSGYYTIYMDKTVSIFRFNNDRDDHDVDDPKYIII